MLRELNDPGRRASLMFLAGLGASAAIATVVDRRAAGWITDTADTAGGDALEWRAPARPGGSELAAAGRAWRHLAASTQPETGLAGSVAGFPSATMWDLGGFAMGLVAARRLDLIGAEEFADRAGRLLHSLGRLPLLDGRLPNKAYDVRSLAMVDYDNTPTARGIGWSALDLCRMLVALRILATESPALARAVDVVLSRWDLGALARAGRLVGADVVNGVTVPHQEGRIGYEQYAARGALLWGLDAVAAALPDPIMRHVEVEGVELPADRRGHDRFDAITPLTSEPYVLAGLELGVDARGGAVMAAMLEAMKRRSARTTHFTMPSEDHLDRAPHFLYATFHADGQPWAVIDDRGRAHPGMLWASTKAAFAWDALIRDRYLADGLARLRSKVASVEGWLAGVYEADGQPNAVRALNTNSVVLEAIHYRARGPLLVPRVPG